MIQHVRAPRVWPGVVSILVLCGIGFGLVSAALLDEVNDSGYYDGDDDDAAVAPERLAVRVDIALDPRARVRWSRRCGAPRRSRVPRALSSRRPSRRRLPLFFARPLSSRRAA